MINFPGFNMFRCDRSGGREGGGVALFVSDKLTGDVLASYDNQVCGLLVVKIYELDTVVCVCYRPPDTTLTEFNGVLKSLDSILSSLPTPQPNIILMGDFNFPTRAMTWHRNEDGCLIPTVGNHREADTMGGKRDRLQAQQLVDIATKFSLQQEVYQPTHAIEILDLVFTNNPDMVSNITTEDWTDFTDHRVLEVSTTFKSGRGFIESEKQHLCEVGVRYMALDFYKAPWDEIRTELADINWEEIKILAVGSPDDALGKFHEKVLNVLEKLVPKKKPKPTKKPKMHRMRRLLWKRHAKAKQKMRSGKSIQQVSAALHHVWELSRQLAADYLSSNIIQEDQAVLRMKENSKSFYSFARSRQKTKSGVGPFLRDGQPDPSPDFCAEQLKQQYDGVFAQPRAEWKVNSPADHFKVDSAHSAALSDIDFSEEDIKAACKQLKASSAPGPDGVPAKLLKVCREELGKPLFYLWRASLDSGNIHAEQ